MEIIKRLGFSLLGLLIGTAVDNFVIITWFKQIKKPHISLIGLSLFLKTLLTSSWRDIHQASDTIQTRKQRKTQYYVNIPSIVPLAISSRKHHPSIKHEKSATTKFPMHKTLGECLAFHEPVSDSQCSSSSFFVGKRKGKSGSKREGRKRK